MKFFITLIAVFTISSGISVELLANVANEARAALEFNQDLVIHKRIQLQSFPLISVPLYKSAGTHGPGILFIHGNSSSSRAFHRQINSDLGRHYKMFFLDLPGHGLASKVDISMSMPMLPDDSGPAGFAEYQEGVAEAIALAANDPEVQAQVIVGWSLGGHAAIKTYGMGLLPKLKGLFVFGTAPATKDNPINVAAFKSHGTIGSTGLPFLPGLGLSFQLSLGIPPFNLKAKLTDPLPFYTPLFFIDYSSRGEAYLKGFFAPYSELSRNPPAFILEDGFVRSDDDFRTSLGVLALELDPRDADLPSELESLKKLGEDEVKVGMAVGEKDMFINIDYLKALKQQGYLPTLWRDEIQIFEGTGHASQLEQPAVFNQMIRSFLEDL